MPNPVGAIRKSHHKRQFKDCIIVIPFPNDKTSLQEYAFVVAQFIAPLTFIRGRGAMNCATTNTFLFMLDDQLEMVLEDFPKPDFLANFYDFAVSITIVRSFSNIGAAYLINSTPIHQTHNPGNLLILKILVLTE